MLGALDEISVRPIFFSIEFSAPMFKSQLVGSIHGQNLRQEGNGTSHVLTVFH